MSTSNLVALAASVRKALAAPLANAVKDEAGKRARNELLDTLPDLQRALEGPKDTLIRTTWTPLNLVALQTVNRHQIGKHVPANGTISYKELSEKINFPEARLRRILRYSMTQRIFHEPELNHVAHTPVSRLMADDKNMQSWISLITDLFAPVVTHANDAFERWPTSNSPKETAVAAWKGAETTWFEEVAASKGGLSGFREGMEAVGSGEGWSTSALAENYPWGEFGSGTVVDIGGASGHACVPIAEAFPDLKFIVQDLEMGDELEKEHRTLLPEAVQSRISFMSHDFFTEQPVKDADVYFFRCTLHNWSDEFVIKALKALVPALKPGARVVIQDNGLAPPGTIGLTEESNQRQDHGFHVNVLDQLQGARAGGLEGVVRGGGS
ncbi:hypothetical protein BP6252_12541 [Coleophoma cylindrospora]|uniref:O-methyltransferase C-terminal domain-containing protein n=1 Tax=Coleophoma cylindrospora TaxID=1849047 RepID=A0A3D8QDE0_9HELO|nr:hypothetical protein BP6252_12541 [Coleophoma cylindrospora]